MFLPDPVDTVGLRRVGLVAEAVEPENLEPGRAQLDAEDPRSERPPELAFDSRAVATGAGRELGGRE